MCNKLEWRRVGESPYWVSSHGDVRRFNRILKGGTAGARGRKYRVVCLVGGEKKKYAYVHKLVAEAFMGPCPDGHEINHKDHNRSNNCVLNLEYVTSSENKFAAVRNGYRGTRRYNAILDDDKVRTIRNLYRDGWLVSEIAKLLNVSLSSVYHVAHEETWKHVKEAKASA